MLHYNQGRKSGEISAVCLWVAAAALCFSLNTWPSTALTHIGPGLNVFLAENVPDLICVYKRSELVATINVV